MKIVRTVLGDIDPFLLRHTQCHEHIFIEKDRSAEINEVLQIDDFDKSVSELMRYRQAGGLSVVDAQPVMAGRMAEWLRDAAKKANVNIIASTGFHKTIFYYYHSYIFSWPEEKIMDLYTNEILSGMISSRTEGYTDTTIRAGIIKTAVDSGGVKADKNYQKLHTAAAQAQRRTGAPVMCHMEKGADVEEVLNFYLDLGVPADRLWLAHLDKGHYDFGLHKQILSTGVYLEYDTIAREKNHSDEDEIALIKMMTDAGYEDQILISLDTTRARMAEYGGKLGLDYIIKTFIPKMKDAEISEDIIEKFTIGNPAEALAIEENLLMQE